MKDKVRSDQPEGGHHLVVREVLVVVFVDGVSTGLCVGPSCVLVAIEAKLQVFGKRHGPRVVGQRYDWCHLKKKEVRQQNRGKFGLSIHLLNLHM